MGSQDVSRLTDPDQLRRFMKAVLNDLRALERMIAAGCIESNVRRIGAEQEMFLIDDQGLAAPVGLDVLKRLNDDHFTTELGLFNIECNLEPLDLRGICLRTLHRNLDDYLARAEQAANDCGAQVLLSGILPTLRKSDLDQVNMTPLPRYYALNDAMRNLRGGDFELRLHGLDELNLTHDSLMLEACNTSCQVHIQVSAEEFAHYYNVAQVVAAPVLAVAVNSPLLLGRRLWQETRIALFQQAVDTRQHGRELQERMARVNFGTQWVEESVLEIYREDIARYRVILGAELDEDPFAMLDRNQVPRLRALNMHNSTIYRWNRPCYGIYDGKPHLRIENRVLPAGPTTADEVANAAFWIGLVHGLAQRVCDVRECMEFDAARANFLAAARSGLDAHFHWVDGKKIPAQELICRKLLPIAGDGLRAADLDESDINHYLGIIERRAVSGRTGAAWLTESLTSMNGNRSAPERMHALVRATIARQQEGAPVHAWPPAHVGEAGGWRENFQRVEQIMTTDVFTVHEDEVIDLVANVMDWRRVRHVPVEDSQHRLIGLVSYRALLRYLARDLPRGDDSSVPVRDIMVHDPVTVSPNTSLLDAIRVMRSQRLSCLPVVSADRLVGVVTERDFMDVATQVFEEHLAHGAPPPPVI